MSKTITDQTLALAGLFQAAIQVQKVARQGRADPQALETALKSVFMIDAETTTDVYGGVANLREGLQSLLDNLGSDARKRDVEQTRYVVTLLHLERRLSKRRDLLQTIGQGIDLTRNKVEMFSLNHENVIAALADIYVNTISNLTPRVMVTGEHGNLNIAENANRVRTLLLAGMRSAVLWSQSGGGRFKLLWNRKRYVEVAGRLLRSLQAETA
jgi:high frequency lysogenization protein